MGAYLSTFAPAIPSFFYAYPMPGPYKTRAVHCRVRAAFTNTVPVDAYRGAGRPEATYVLERLMDAAARELSIDRIEMRRRNLIPAEAFPYKTPLLWTYDVARPASSARPRGGGRRLRRLRSAPRWNRRRAASCAASASPITWNPAAWARRSC